MQKPLTETTDTPPWGPTSRLRFREQGEKGMLLEQLFVCITSEGFRTEWRPVPVVPEMEGVQQ